MIRRAFRKGLSLGVLAGAVMAVVRALQGRRGGPLTPLPVSEPWPALPDEPRATASLAPSGPGVPAVDLDVVAAPGPDPQPTRAAGEATAWVPPVERGCPASHPVKARLASRIFHLPGMVDYERTRPDRCYVDATAAEGDGFRPARR